MTEPLQQPFANEDVDEREFDDAPEADEDVEGHKFHGLAVAPRDDDDVEGHRFHGA